MIMNCQSHARSLWPPDFKSILSRLRASFEMYT